MVLQKIREKMSQEAIIGMIICLSITFGGFVTFLTIALKSDKKNADAEE
tara:strand:+ start:90504 stop:90650 length:147 start_codon:yes stop_codon:yes gene_type:complete